MNRIERKLLLRLFQQAVMPAILVAGTYVLVVDWSLQKSCTERQVRLNELHQSQESAKPTLTGLRDKLSALHMSKRDIAVQLEAARLQQTVLTSQHAESDSNGCHGKSQIEYFARLVDLLEQHSLHCQEQTPLDTTKPEAAKSQPAKHSVAQSTEPGTRLETSNDDGPQTVRFKLRGGFVNVREAIHEVQTALTCISIVSLEMLPASAEPGTDDQSLHDWVLVVTI